MAALFDVSVLIVFLFACGWLLVSRIPELNLLDCISLAPVVGLSAGILFTNLLAATGLTGRQIAGVTLAALAAAVLWEPYLSPERGCCLPPVWSSSTGRPAVGFHMFDRSQELSISVRAQRQQFLAQGSIRRNGSSDLGPTQGCNPFVRGCPPNRC